MKTKTDIRAGMTFEECDAQRNYGKAWRNPVIATGISHIRLRRTHLRHIRLRGFLFHRARARAHGIGHGERILRRRRVCSILGQDNLVHYFNAGYTQFYPNGQGVSVGQHVSYAPSRPATSGPARLLYLIRILAGASTAIDIS